MVTVDGSAFVSPDIVLLKDHGTRCVMLGVAAAGVEEP